jgi:hypothetical protein
MADFTIVLQRGDDPQTTSHLVAAETFAEAKGKAFRLFEQGGDGHGYVAIARGDGDPVEWIGAFDFAPGSGPRWEAAD